MATLIMKSNSIDLTHLSLSLTVNQKLMLLSKSLSTNIEFKLTFKWILPSKDLPEILMNTKSTGEMNTKEERPCSSTNSKSCSRNTKRKLLPSSKLILTNKFLF